MAYEFKKLSDVEIAETPSDTANVLIEEDGVIKKAPKSAVGGGIQPDWNQNDSTQPDYVKNRPFWTDDPEEIMLYTKTSANPVELVNVVEEFVVDGIEIGKEYTVSLFGKIYNCVAYAGTVAPNCITLGFEGIFNGEIPEENEEPFGFITAPSYGRTLLMVSEKHISELDSSLTEFTFSISGIVEMIHRIDAKYLPIATDTQSGVVSKREICNMMYATNYIHGEIGEMTQKQLIERARQQPFYYIQGNNATIWVIEHSGAPFGDKYCQMFVGIDLNSGQRVSVIYKFPDNSEEAVLCDIVDEYPVGLYLDDGSGNIWHIYINEDGTVSAEQTNL